jgi:hypothetical protein
MRTYAEAGDSFEPGLYVDPLDEIVIILPVIIVHLRKMIYFHSSN